MKEEFVLNNDGVFPTKDTHHALSTNDFGFVSFRPSIPPTG